MLLRNISIGNEIIPSYLFETTDQSVSEILKISNSDKYILVYDAKLQCDVDEIYMHMEKRTSVFRSPRL